MNQHDLPEGSRGEHHDQGPDESLANMSPQPVQEFKTPTIGGLTWGISALAVAGLGTILITASSTTRCAGATRSSKLIYEQREAEIEQAIRDRQAAELPEATNDVHDIGR
ncbi:MAG: hypothetical protein AB7O68_03275 [Pirellulales bacterium]